MRSSTRRTTRSFASWSNFLGIFQIFPSPQAEQTWGVSATRHAIKSQRPAEIIEAIDPVANGNVTIAKQNSEGTTNRQIATRLNYAEITIKKKVSALLRKYGMQNRAELATLAAKFA